MSEKTIQFVVCDNCKKEEELQVKAKDKETFKKYVKFVGFVTTDEHDFCSEHCKRIFVKNLNME
jgi:hypothetical protein